MATADKVETLVEQDEGIADAMEAVYRAADGGEREVEWGDVKDDISSGHWGRLIEQGVLIDGGNGFRLGDPDAMAAVLDGVEAGDVSTAEDGADADVEDEGWTKYDKMAAVGSVAMFAGYSLQEVRGIIGGFVDLFVGPLNAVVPFHVTVLIIAVVTGLVSALVQGNMMNMDKMQEYQDRMQEIQDRRKAAQERGDDEALEKIQQEQMDAMGDQLGMFKEQFRPTVWIMLLSIPMFLWIYWKILDGNLTGSETVVFPLAGEVRWNDGVVGPMQAWIVWYFVCSMSFSNIIRKALNLKSPTGD